jgi:CheY-like chemotaxis protein
MKKLSLVFMSALAVVAEPLFACGDKFLVVSRGTRHQRAPLGRPSASILVYANPSTSLPQALSNVPIDKTLRRAGYRSTSVTTAEELEKALREHEWDLIVADIQEGNAIRARLDGRGVVLPVIHAASVEELAKARKEYHLLLSAPTKAEAFLEAVDDAVALKQKNTAKTRR